MAHGLVVRLSSVVFFAWILAQPAAHAQSLEEIKALDRQAAQLHNQGQYAEAIKLAQQALSLAEKSLGPEHPSTIASINNLGELHERQGRYREAEALYQRALTGRERMHGPEHPDTLASVNTLARIYQQQGRYAQAEPLYERAVKGREKALGPEHLDTLASVDALAGLYQQQGRYAQAEPLYQRALRGREKALGPEHPDTLMDVHSLANLHGAQGRYSEAEPLLKQAQAGYERRLGPEHALTLGGFNDLAALYLEMGRYDEAEPLYRRTLAGREKTLGLEHPYTLTSVNNLGILYVRQGRYDEAEPLFGRALAGQEKTLGPEHPYTLGSLNNLASLFQVQGRYAQAEPLLKRSLASQEKTLGPEHPSTLASLHSLAALHDAQGRHSEAERLYKRGLADREKALGPEHPLTLLSVSNLGFVYQAQGRHAEAKPLQSRALAGREKVLGPEHPDTLTTVSRLAAVHFAQRDWQQAAQLWRRSTAAIARRIQRGALDAGLTGKKRSETQQNGGQFRGLIKATYRLTPGGLMPDPGAAGEMFQTAQWAVSSEAAQSLTQMAARGAKDDPVLAKLVRERQDLVDQWQRREKIQAEALGRATAKRDAKAEAENREQMAAIDLRIAEIDQRLKVEFADYAALAGPAPLAVQEVQAQLAADEALVLFLDTPQWQPTPEETFIWVITQSEMRWVRSDLGQAALATDVRALRCGLDGAAWEGKSGCAELTGQARPGGLLPFDHARAHRLYRALFGEVEDLIKGKHLLIVPSGALTQLPFAALLTAPSSGDNKKAAWFVRDHAITMLPAVSSLKALRATGRPSAATKPLIGFGNPLLDGTGENNPGARLAREKQACTKIAPQRVANLSDVRKAVAPIEIRSGLADVSLIRHLEPLPETADELCAVASDAGAEPGEIRLGARAREQEIKQMSKAGKLAQYRVVHFATHGAMAGELKGSTDPGLILTPPDAATEEDDGYLTAAEIASLKLDADWVILSACNTAAGNAPNAEALSGLARAFFYAQTRALLVSHWAVNSHATVKLITTAMREIAKDKAVGRSEALRRAALVMIDEGEAYEAHPSLWAPFIVVGEGTH